MSGSGNHFGDKLAREVRSALALLFKNLRVDSADLNLSAQAVVYEATLKTASWGGSITGFIPPKTIDALGALGFKPPVINYGDVFLWNQAPLREISCRWQPVLISDPIFASGHANLVAMDFSNITHRQSAGLTIEPLAELTPMIKTVELRQNFPRSFAMNLANLSPIKPVHRVAVSVFKKITHAFPKPCWLLPLIRRPIPPHRFSSELKTIFRQALAEKAGVSQAKIQLQVIYDRINLVLFSNIDQDERGNLVCYPKAETASRLEKPGAERYAYLVVGMRMDTRETVKSLVPMT